MLKLEKKCPLQKNVWKYRTSTKYPSQCSMQYKTTGNTNIGTEFNLSLREKTINRNKPWDGPDTQIMKGF